MKKVGPVWSESDSKSFDWLLSESEQIFGSPFVLYVVATGSSRKHKPDYDRHAAFIQTTFTEAMVWGKILDKFAGEPTLPPGPTKLPDYFPVEPVGCEKHAQALFACLSNEATQKARDMEKAGLHKSYFKDVVVAPVDEKAAKLVAESSDDPSLPKPGQNPLDECRTPIAYYRRCCERELKKRKNWILTEPYRVQEEYRYSGKN